MTINVAIIGWGNVGRFCKKVLEASPDMHLSGIVRRSASLRLLDEELSCLKVVDDIQKLGKVDVAIVAVPSRLAPEKVYHLLEKGVACVDSFDIHTDILAVKEKLNKQAIRCKTSCILGAGWDPGSDSVIRTLMRIVSPTGETNTTFGGLKGGRSMGHTAAVKTIKGVKNAVAITLPNGAGKQKRKVYIELEKDANFAQVSSLIQTDDYFKNDPTEVIAVEDITPYDTLNHGGELTRITSSISQSYTIEGINPFMTANVLVSSARAVFLAKQKQDFGAFTMIERPLIDFLAGNIETQLKGY